MAAFFRYFSKTLGILFGIMFFLIFIAIITNLFNIKDKSNFSFFDGNNDSNKKIAILNINGPIISDPKSWYNYDIFKSVEVIYPSLIKNFITDLKREKILGLIISINSPGGSVSATNKIYNLIDNYKKDSKIPIYFHTSNMLASGGYWVSLSGDKIFADYGAMLGSIGVKGPDWIYYNSPTSLSKGLLGVSIESPNGIEVYSNIAGTSKDIFNPFRKPTKKEKNELQKLVNDIYYDFINLVSSKRKIEKNELQNKIGAMIFNSTQAEKNYLKENKKNLDATIKEIILKLKLTDVKIIMNQKTNSYKFFSLNNISNFFSNKDNKYYKNLIMDKFCNNLSNEFSAALLSFKNNRC